MNAVLDTPRSSDAATSARFGSSITCYAAGIDRKTLNNWLSRQPAVVLLTDEERREAGERNRFSFDRNRVVQIALTAELVRLGVQPRRSAMCAATFTDAAEGPGAHPRFAPRMPGELFKNAYTFLVVPPGDVAPKVVPVSAETTVIELMHPEYGLPFSTAIVVKVDDVVERVRAALLAGS
ncbi:hypothetical protein [Methylobacterium bullatum]|uniref:Uncharacterized protein n=1 Tax=Methylobacterium bullatum TaxID=570505 RepID=A0A679JQ34_9HYPH|nr:hypothetical protein MBLL_01297 [Methylobacterium bullatum]